MKRISSLGLVVVVCMAGCVAAENNDSTGSARTYDTPNLAEGSINVPASPGSIIIEGQPGAAPQACDPSICDAPAKDGGAAP